MRSITLSDSTKRIYIYVFLSVLSMMLAFLINWLMTRFVSPPTYGLYKYATNFLFTIPAFFEFGIHFSCSRIVAEKNANEKDGVVFASSVIVIFLGLLLTGGMYVVNLVCGHFNLGIGSLRDISIVYPIIAVFTFRILVLQVYQGTAKTNQLAILNLIQYAIVIAGMLLGKLFSIPLSFSYLILLFCGSWASVTIPFALRMSYSFKDFSRNFNLLYQETKSNGFYVYLGSIVSTGASSVIGLISGSIYGYAEYGYYSLAISFAQAFTVISNAMATVKFKDNVSQKSIPRKDFQLMIGLSVLVYAGFLLVINPVFRFFFSSDYLPAIEYMILLGLVYSIMGVTLYFNRFFVARGLGLETTYNSILMAVVNIGTSIVLIPIFQIRGLIYASLVSSIISLIKYIHSYRRYLRRTQNVDGATDK